MPASLRNAQISWGSSLGKTYLIRAASSSLAGIMIPSSVVPTASQASPNVFSGTIAPSLNPFHFSSCQHILPSSLPEKPAMPSTSPQLMVLLHQDANRLQNLLTFTPTNSTEIRDCFSSKIKKNIFFVSIHQKFIENFSLSLIIAIFCEILITLKKSLEKTQFLKNFNEKKPKYLVLSGYKHLNR